MPATDVRREWRPALTTDGAQREDPEKQNKPCSEKGGLITGSARRLIRMFKWESWLRRHRRFRQLQARAISPRRGDGGKSFLSSPELSEDPRLGVGRERRVRAGDQVGSTGTSGAYLRASRIAFGPVVWITPTPLSVKSETLITRARVADKALRDVRPVLLVFVSAGRVVGVGDRLDEARHLRAETRGQDGERAGPAVRRQVIGVVFNRIVEQRGGGGPE
jgi:hypothetical protein